MLAGGVLGPGLEGRREPDHGRRPFGRAELRPRARVKGLPGRGHGHLDVRSDHRGDGARDFLGGRVHDRDHVGRTGSDQAAARVDVPVLEQREFLPEKPRSTVKVPVNLHG